MITKMLGKEAATATGRNPKETEVTETEMAILKHLFTDFDVTRAKKFSKGKIVSRKIEVEAKKIGAVTRLLKLLRTAATTAVVSGLRIELRLSESDASLLNNLREYIPTDSLDTPTSALQSVTESFSQNSVHWLTKRGERINKAIKISMSALVTYLTEHYKLSTKNIPALVGKDVLVYLLGTTKDHTPQSLIFFVNGAGGQPQSIRLHHHKTRQPRTGFVPA